MRFGATGQRLMCWPEVDGQKLNPTTGPTVSIYGPQSTTALVSSAAVTEGSNNELYYDLDASGASFALGESYRAVFTWQTATATYPPPVREIVFDVVRQPIIHFPPMSVEDLKRAHVMVQEALTQSDTETTAHDRWIIPAWQDVLRWVAAQGNRPSLVSPPETLYGLLEVTALARFFRAIANSGGGDISLENAKHYEAAIVDERRLVVLRYDPADGVNHQKERAWQQPELRVGNDLATGGGLLSVGRLVSGGYRGRY